MVVKSKPIEKLEHSNLSNYSSEPSPAKIKDKAVRTL